MISKILRKWVDLIIIKFIMYKVSSKICSKFWPDNFKKCPTNSLDLNEEFYFIKKFI